MYKSNKTLIMVMAILTVVGPTSAFIARADDTTEAFSPGLSDLEGYFAQVEDRSMEYEWVVGYGITDRLSLGLGYATAHGEHQVIPAYSAEAFVTVWDQVIDWDWMAGAGLEDPPKAEGEDSHSYWVTTELSLPTTLMTPYARMSYEWVHEDEEAAGYPLTAGLLVPAFNDVEVIATYDWFLSRQESSKNGRSWSFGLNAMMTDEFEFLAEYRESLESEEDQWTGAVSIGFILTMDRVGKATALGKRNHRE